MTEIEETVLTYIVTNIDHVMKLGVRGVAKENFTSTSTIMRLTKKLGYTGFVDMHYQLLPLVKKSEIVHNSDMQFIGSFSTNTLLEYNSYDKIRGFADLLFCIKEKYIFIYATGFSAIMAEYMYKKFLVLGKKCILASGMDSIGVFENNLNDVAAFIVVSKSGETKMVLDKVQTAKENGIFIASVTGEGDNTIGTLSDTWFRVEDSNKLDDRNMMANTFFPNVLMLVELLAYEYHRLLVHRKNSIEQDVRNVLPK